METWGDVNYVPWYFDAQDHFVSAWEYPQGYSSWRIQRCHPLGGKVRQENLWVFLRESHVDAQSQRVYYLARDPCYHVPVPLIVSKIL